MLNLVGVHRSRLCFSRILLQPGNYNTGCHNLSGGLNAGLFLVIQACTLRLMRHDTIDSQRVMTQLQEKHRNVEHDMRDEERKRRTKGW
jgi:hypothetical protein